MKTARIGIFAFLAFFALFWATAAYADLYWENENVSRGVPHHRDGTTLQKNYFTSSAMRVEPGDGKVLIVEYDSMTMYTLDPRTKTYTQMDLNDIPGLPANAPAAQKEQLKQLMGAMQIKITPTNETKTIEGYRCRKYLMNMMMANGVYWVSKEVRGYKELKAITAKLAAISEKNPMFQQMNAAGMLEKLDGFPVQTENDVMGGKIISTLKKVEQKRLDPALFRVPKDYAQKSPQGRQPQRPQ